MRFLQRAWLGRAVLHGLFALLLSACVSEPISVQPADDPSSALIREKWLPRTQDALQRFDQRMREALSVTPPHRPRVVLAASEKQYSELRKDLPQVYVANMDTYVESDLYERSVVDAVHAAAWQFFSSYAVDPEVPAWLKDGLAWQQAYAVMDALQSDALSSHDLLGIDRYAIRNNRYTLTYADVLADGRFVRQEKGFEYFSTLLVRLLQEQLGSRFEQAWPVYMRASKQPGFKHEQAFERAFGLSSAQFAALARDHFAALRTMKFEHAAPLPPLSTTRGADAVEFLPERKSTREAYARYLKLPTPRAFALSRRGAWVYFADNPDAVRRAMQDCISIDKVSCRLFSVDDYMVADEQRSYEPEFVLETGAEEAWQAQLATRWMPAIKSSVGSLREVLRARMGVDFQAPMRIHVAGTRDAYARVLRENIRQEAAQANSTAEHSAGLSNQNGQMVLSMLQTDHEEYLWERAVTVTTHELVHEIQGQQKGAAEGFRTRRWLDEGTADQISNLATRAMPLGDAARYEIEDWRESCIVWYRLHGVRTTRPEDVWNVSYEQWLKLIADNKGPYEMSGLLVMHLESLLGDKYYPSLLKYWRLSGKKGQVETEAFKESFGLSPDEFLASSKRWLASLN